MFFVKFALLYKCITIYTITVYDQLRISVIFNDLFGYLFPNYKAMSKKKKFYDDTRLGQFFGPERFFLWLSTEFPYYDFSILSARGGY